VAAVTAQRVIVVGAGVGGLCAAIGLAARGFAVEVLERAATPGGKLREVAIGAARLDAGPTVFTMRWVFDELFAEAGTTLEAELGLRPVEVLARHAWSAEERLDLFADPHRSAAAIAAFAGAAEGRRFLTFCAETAAIYRALERSFIAAAKPRTPLALIRRAGVLPLLRIKPYVRMWRALGRHFRDPRLRQLFGRYATYCGSSPFLAPATLMLVAHVEQQGVWLVEGGMHALAQALVRVATRLGVKLRYRTEVSELLVSRGRCNGVRLATGETLHADAVVFNGEVAALGQGLLGAAATRAIAPIPVQARSLSALTWNLLAPTRDFPLLRHNVFFSDNYPAEFADLFRQRRLPRAPTVYICAQDRDDRDDMAPNGAERLLCLVNAPPNGDRHRFTEAEIESCAANTFRLLERCGLNVSRTPATTVATTPTHLADLFPGSGGALYGRSSHGWLASFLRPGTTTRMPGLYLAGGSTHPGPGVPMAALSGRLAAHHLSADRALIGLSRPTVISGGTSTGSATMPATD